MKKRLRKCLALLLVLALAVSNMGTLTLAVEDGLPMENAEEATTVADTENTETIDTDTEADDVISGTCGDNLTWTLENGVLTISGTGEMTDWGVVRNVPWYDYYSSIKTVEIESGVTSIADYAFYYCSSLTSITIPDSVTFIGDYAFYNCSSLTNIFIPDSVTSIGNYAFSDCSTLTSITIPDSVTFIGEYAFYNCNKLTSVMIPSGVTKIYASTFCNCISLTSIIIPDSVTYIYDCAFGYCSSLTSITIPDSVTFISEMAFRGCTSLTSITLPDSVTYIGDYVFYNCSRLTNIFIPDSVTGIGNYAFYACSALTSITIPDSVTFIGYCAFYNCSSLTDVYYSGSEYDWASIDTSYGDPYLTSATIHYNSTGPEDVVDATISEITVSKLTTDEEYGDYFTEDYEALYVGDAICFSVEVTVDADTELDFSESDWTCDDEDAVVFDALSVVGPNASEDDETKQVYYVSMQAELAASGLCTVTFTLSADESRVLTLDLTVFSSQNELQLKYIDEHLNYYCNGSYTTDIVSMSQTQGLGFMLEDAADDLSDNLYESLTALISITDLGNYVEVEVEGIENFELSIDCEPIDSVTGYSAIIYQLMANDEVYSGIQDTFSLGLQKNILSLAKLLLSNFEDLIKDDLNEDTVAAAKESFATAVQALEEMDPESDGYQEAWMDVGDLCTEYYDSKEMLSFFESAFDTSDALFTVVSTLLKEIQTFGEAYQYMCWAETYAETCDAFKTILEDLKDEAWSRYQIELANSLDVYMYGSVGYHYRNISNAIDEWLEKMDAYEESAFEAFVDQIANGTVTTIVEVGVNGLVKIGTSLIPFLGPLNKALKAGKMGIDMFTDIGAEYKASFTVTCLSYVVNLLTEVSKDYGTNLIKYNFEDAVLFDESINMYKNAMLLACEYGLKYEELKLASAREGLDDEKYAPLSVDTLWYYNAGQEKASQYSMALALLGQQIMEISDIHCHEDGLTYNSSTGLVEYEDSVRVITIFCPVDVTVYDENGTQIAYLTDGDAEVASGYEHYFYIVPENDENDYIKVAVLPDGEEYQIFLSGTGEGTMSVYVGRYDGEVITEEEVYANFPITVSTTGYIDTGDKDNSLGYLVLDGTTYGQIEYTSTIGDINMDGSVSGKDLIYLRQYLAGNSVTIDEAAADVNQDGEINGKDLIYLRKLLAN